MSIDFTKYPALVAAARNGLCEPMAHVVVADDEADRIVNLARYDHISGLLAWAVLDGLVVMNEPQHGKLMESWHQELHACVFLEALLLRTAIALDGAGVAFRLTKGAAVAHLDYSDPSQRTFGDVDLIIHPDDWELAVNTLVTGGCRRESTELPHDFDRRYGKGATMTTPEGLEIDLHRRLAIGRFAARSEMSELFLATNFIHLAGREVPVLSPEHRLLHACYHASLGGFRRLRAFRDVAQLVLRTEVDHQLTYEIARRWKAEAVVSAAVVETWHRLQLDRSHPVFLDATDRRISRADRRALNVFAQDQPFRRQALTAVARLGPVRAPRYLWSLAAHRIRPPLRTQATT